MKKALAVISTDWHLDRDNLQEIKYLVLQKIELAKSLKVDFVICLGDIFENRKSQPLQNLKGFDEILELFQKAKIKLIAIPGNHDKLSYVSEDSYLDEFRFHPNFQLIRDYNYIQLNEEGNILGHFIPYFEETKCDLYLDYLKKSIEKINDLEKGSDTKKGDKIPNYKHILFTHVSISGVKNNDFSVVQNNVQQNLFKQFDKVFVGHYHDRSEVGINIQYIGSIQQNNFGEDDQKGFCVLYDDLTYELINSDFRKYIKIIIDLDEVSLNEVDNLLKDYSNNYNYIRFEFIGDESKVKSIDDNKFKTAGIDVKKKQKNIEQEIIKAANNEIISFTKKDIFEEFDKFCKEKNLENIDYGRQILMKKMEEK